jgi:hypothetical protein
MKKYPRIIFHVLISLESIINILSQWWFLKLFRLENRRTDCIFIKALQSLNRTVLLLILEIMHAEWQNRPFLLPHSAISSRVRLVLVLPLFFLLNHAPRLAWQLTGLVWSMDVGREGHLRVDIFTLLARTKIPLIGDTKVWSTLRIS